MPLKCVPYDVPRAVGISNFLSSTPSSREAGSHKHFQGVADETCNKAVSLSSQRAPTVYELTFMGPSVSGNKGNVGEPSLVQQLISQADEYDSSEYFQCSFFHPHNHQCFSPLSPGCARSHLDRIVLGLLCDHYPTRQQRARTKIRCGNVPIRTILDRRQLLCS